MIQNMSPHEIDKLLSKASVGRLALAESKEPYIVPLSYVYVNKTIYFHSWHEGKKIEMMHSNPKVCFEVDEYEGDLSRWESIISKGIAEEVNNQDEKIKVMQAFFNKYGMPDMDAHGLMTKMIGENIESVTPQTYQEVMKKVPLKIIKISLKEVTGKKNGDSLKNKNRE